MLKYKIGDIPLMFDYKIIMLSGDVAYGGDVEWAGNVGLSIGLGKNKKNNK